MNKFATLLLLFFVIHSINAKLEGTTKNSFLHFINSEKSVGASAECFTTPSSDKTCIILDQQAQILKGNQCQKNEYCLDIIEKESQVTGKCKSVGKFFGESCEKNEDCYTKKCENKKCTRKNTEEECVRDRECGLKDYCRYSDEKADKGVCSPFTESDTSCNHSYSRLNKCHPKYECYYDNQCIPRGVKKEGEKVEHEFECESFKADNDGTGLKCTNKYNGGYSDLEKKAKAESFKSINWADENLKLSDYAGSDAGSAFALDDMYTSCMQTFDKNLCDCGIKIVKQGYIGMILSDTKDMNGDLPDKKIKDILASSQTQNSSYLIKLGIGFIISILGLF